MRLPNLLCGAAEQCAPRPPELGLAAQAFAEAWALAESVAHVRRAAPQYPPLVDAAKAVAASVAKAWSAYRSALAATPNVLLEKTVRDLDDWAKRAPAADGVESPSYATGAYGHIVNWRKTLDVLTESVGTELAASPAKHQPLPWLHG